MQRKKIILSGGEPRKMLDPFMPRPDYCEEGLGPIFNGEVCIDITICEFSCSRDCPAYIEYSSGGQDGKLKPTKRR